MTTWILFDDERSFKPGYGPNTDQYTARTPQEFDALIDAGAFPDVLVLDHDLGMDPVTYEDITSRKSVARWLELVRLGKAPEPQEVVIVSGNPVGVRFFISEFARAGVRATTDPYGRRIGLTAEKPRY